jgi:hypothetical protein
MDLYLQYCDTDLYENFTEEQLDEKAYACPHTPATV